MIDLNKIRTFNKALLLTLPLLIASCSSDDDAVTTNDEIVTEEEVVVTPPVDPIVDENGPEIADLNLVFNKYKLEDRTEGDALLNASGIDNGYGQMLTNDASDEYYIGLTDFNNIDEPIDRNHPNIIASQFAVFLTTAGASLDAQSAFDEGDRPIYIGTLINNGENVIELIPAAENGGDIVIGGVTISTNTTFTTNSGGYIIPQRSTGSRNSWYDWVVLHPFEGDNLRPISYPGIVADLDADHQLEQNFEQTYNTFALEDRTDSDAVANPSGIDNSDALIVSYDGASYLRLSDFNNIDGIIDFMYPNITASQFAVFLTTGSAPLNTQNGYDAGDQPVYLGTVDANGFQDLALKPFSGNENGSVQLGANGISINTNSNIAVNADGDIIPQDSTGARAVAYDWIVLHPFQGENLRPVGYPSIVADLDAENEN